MTTTTRVFTDRSRVETYQRCKRLRFLEYHAEGIGLTSARKPLPLAVGGAVHKGLEALLRAGEEGLDRPLVVEEMAVEAAIADLAQHRGAMALDPYETSQVQVAAPIPDDQMRQQLADSLGVSLEEAGLLSLQSDPGAKAKEFDDYLWTEQSILVEAMVRAYARRRLRPLLEEFEVLEVEREGEWELAHCLPVGYRDEYSRPQTSEERTLMFMSRPDALLRSRHDNSLYLLSFKTAASWDYRKARDAEHDMQGLSEGVEVERRRGERIMGIRYEYLLKGERWHDKDLTARFGFECRSQRSHLIRQYVAESVPQSKKGPAPFSHGDVCWSWDYLRDDATEGKLAWQNWKSRPVANVRDWIDALDDSQIQMSAYDSTVGQEPREMGWKSKAQALGLTAQHPLDAVFVPPIIIYRSDDDYRDWLEQTEHQERNIAEAVALVEAASADEKPSLLNQHFPMTRRACSYPTECIFSKTICYASDEAKADPLGTGKFKRREPHHAAELEASKP